MILKYQRPRITYYLNKLRKALRFEEPTTCTTQDKRPRLSDEWLQRLPVLHTRSWIDDNENEFQFSGASLDEAENISRAALSAQSLKKHQRRGRQHLQTSWPGLFFGWKRGWSSESGNPQAAITILIFCLAISTVSSINQVTFTCPISKLTKFRKAAAQSSYSPEIPLSSLL